MFTYTELAYILSVFHTEIDLADKLIKRATTDEERERLAYVRAKLVQEQLSVKRQMAACQYG